MGCGSGALAGHPKSASLEAIVSGAYEAKFPGSAAAGEVNESYAGDLSARSDASVAGNCAASKPGVARGETDSVPRANAMVGLCARASPHSRHDINNATANDNRKTSLFTDV